MDKMWMFMKSETIYDYTHYTDNNYFKITEQVLTKNPKISQIPCKIWSPT